MWFGWLIVTSSHKRNSESHCFSYNCSGIVNIVISGVYAAITLLALFITVCGWWAIGSQSDYNSIRNWDIEWLHCQQTCYTMWFFIQAWGTFYAWWAMANLFCYPVRVTSSASGLKCTFVAWCILQTLATVFSLLLMIIWLAREYPDEWV